MRMGRTLWVMTFIPFDVAELTRRATVGSHGTDPTLPTRGVTESAHAPRRRQVLAGEPARDVVADALARPEHDPHRAPVPN